MDLLAYWKWETYERDGHRPHGFQFNSDQKRLFDDIGVGQRLWLVSGRRSDNQRSVYVLLSCLQITGKECSFPERNDYGKYFRVWGDPERSRDFSPDGQDAENLLMSFDFRPPRRIPARDKIGQALQSIRALSSRDERLFEEYASTLRPVRLTFFRKLRHQ